MKTINRPIFIVGMDRSGTSIVANMVSRWGAFGGDPRTLEHKDSRNATGFFENEALEYFIRDLLIEVGVNFWEADFRDRLLQCANDPKWVSKAEALIGQMDQTNQVWFWKEPLLSVLLPFWKTFLPDPVYVITLRNPHHSATSYERFVLPEKAREAASGVQAFMSRWQFMLREIMQETKSANHWHFVSYEALLADVSGTAAALEGYLDDAFQRPCQQRATHMAQVVDPKLCHHREEIPFDQNPLVTPAQKAFYQFLLAKKDAPDLAYHEDEYPMTPGFDEQMKNLEFIIEYYEALDPLLDSWLVQLALFYRVVVINTKEALFHFFMRFRRSR